MTVGWQNKTIGELCVVIAGQSPEGSSYNTDGQGVPFFQGKKEFGEKFIGKPTTWTTEPTKIAKDGDILMSVRAPVGPVNFSKGELCIGRGLAAIRSDPQLDRDFLFYQLRYLRPTIAGKEGAVFASISKSEIEALPISVASLSEQQRIVGLLDEVFEDIATAKANAEKNLQNARALFESCLRTVFSRSDNGWHRQIHLSSVLSEQPRNGWSPPLEFQTGAGVPVLTLSSVTGFEYNGARVKMSSAPTRSDANYWLKGGELLITRSNTPELVGHVAIYDGNPAKVICCDLIMKMTVNSTKALTRFIYYYLRSPEARAYIVSRAQGASSTMKKIGKQVVQGILVPLPPLSEQRSAVLMLDAYQQEVRRLAAIYQRKLAALDELKQSLLHQAFSGAL